jgi:tricorn protease
VDEGDFLLAVNGQPLDPKEDPWAAFGGLANQVVTLTINSEPTMTGAREILVKPLASESRLRNLAWIEKNREYVEKKTGGRIGYIYVPDTGYYGQNELVRQFTPQFTLDGLIIDERFNSGGQIPDRFIELLNRPLYNFWARREHRDWQTPFVSYFRKAGLGPLVGTRTWGGLIGMSGNPDFVDGGRVTAPTFGFWNTEGEWEVENYGVQPDYELENLPHELAGGRDAQLDKAIELVLDLLGKNPPKRPIKPAYPNKAAGM